jgi:hypothetical protein
MNRIRRRGNEKSSSQRGPRAQGTSVLSCSGSALNALPMSFVTSPYLAPLLFLQNSALLQVS